MQINGAQLATVFPSKLLEPQDNTRKPVIIDVQATVELDTSSTNRYPVKGVPPNQSSLIVHEQQQAQFVRFFAVTDLTPASHSLLSNKENSTQTSFAQLSKGVQQYLQVAATGLEFQQGLLDETV
tara:strand:+ start:45498 stop:45872 length:375 start_codon:yes stop_codon:yes gene_type:complete